MEEGEKGGEGCFKDSQLGEDAVKGRAGAARDGQHDPLRAAAPRRARTADAELLRAGHGHVLLGLSSPTGAAAVVDGGGVGLMMLKLRCRGGGRVTSSSTAAALADHGMLRRTERVRRTEREESGASVGTRETVAVVVAVVVSSQDGFHGEYGNGIGYAPGGSDASLVVPLRWSFWWVVPLGWAGLARVAGVWPTGRRGVWQWSSGWISAPHPPEAT